jgi:hypothetical protein
LQASFPPVVRAAVLKYGAGKTALEQTGRWWLNQQRRLKISPENTKKLISRSFGCCLQRNLGNFARKTALDARPTWGVLKAFFRGPSEVPVVRRK